MAEGILVLFNLIQITLQKTIKVNNYESKVNSIFYNNVFFVTRLIIANSFHNLCHLTSFVSFISGKKCTSSNRNEIKTVACHLGDLWRK